MVCVEICFKKSHCTTKVKTVLVTVQNTPTEMVDLTSKVRKSFA